MRVTVLGLVVLTLVFAARDARALELDGIHPTAGAPGDRVYVQAAGLRADAEVLFGARRASIVRASESALICRVPRGLAPGPVRVVVDGRVCRDAFAVLVSGSPVVHGISASVLPPGRTLLLYGRRLGGGEAQLVDARGVVAARAGVVGGRRVVAMHVSSGLAAGHYAVRVVNAAGISDDESAPSVEVRAARLRSFHSVGGSLVCPGRHVVCRGTDLARLGSCELRWENGDGTASTGVGWSNGYDRITTLVPLRLETERWHRLQLVTRSGVRGDLCRVFVRAAEIPHRLELDVDAADPGERVGLRGMGRSGLGGIPRLALQRGATEIFARTLYRHPGGLGHARSWIVQLPGDLEGAIHRLQVRIEETWAEAGILRVRVCVPPECEAGR